MYMHMYIKKKCVLKNNIYVQLFLMEATHKVSEGAPSAAAKKKGKEKRQKKHFFVGYV